MLNLMNHARDDRSERLLSTKDAARRLALSHRTLEQWRWRGEGPPYVKINRQVRYKLSELLDFVERGARGLSGQAA